MGEPSGHGQVRYTEALCRKFVGELDSERLQVKAGDTPLVHHGPGAHTGTARGAVDGEEVDLGLGTPAHGHCKLDHGVGAGLEGDPLEPDLSKALHFGHERLPANKAKPRVPFELSDSAVIIAHCNFTVVGIGGDDVTTACKLPGALDILDLDLSTDTLGALSPLELDGVKTVLLDNVLGDSQPGVLDVHLYQDLAVPFLELSVGVDPAVHFRRALHLVVFVQFQLGIDTADILTAHKGHTADGGAHGKMFPVDTGDVR